MRDVNKAYASNRGAYGDYVKVFGVIGLVTLFGWFTPLSYLALGYLYLLAVIALSTRLTRWPALAGAVVSSLAWNFFFVPPRLSFSVLRFDESLLLVTYFVVALIGSQLTALRYAADRASLLAESDRMHKALLDNVAHELKTPVSVLRIAVEQLGSVDTERRAHVMVELGIAVQRLDTVVCNLLNQIRLEAGVVRPRLDWCDARDLVSAARRSVGSRLDEHPVSVEISRDFPPFLADAALMEQSIAHLLLNAAVHTPPSTAILVSGSVREDRERVTLSVADNGPGVPEDQRGMIFEKFSRGHKAKVGGLGLGLSIVRGFMSAQGGDVAVDSPLGGGASFTLSLPLVPHDDAPQG